MWQPVKVWNPIRTQRRFMSFEGKGKRGPIRHRGGEAYKAYETGWAAQTKSPITKSVRRHSRKLHKSGIFSFGNPRARRSFTTLEGKTRSGWKIPRSIFEEHRLQKPTIKAIHRHQKKARKAHTYQVNKIYKQSKGIFSNPRAKRNKTRTYGTFPGITGFYKTKHFGSGIGPPRKRHRKKFASQLMTYGKQTRRRSDMFSNPRAKRSFSTQEGWRSPSEGKWGRKDSDVFFQGLGFYGKGDVKSVKRHRRRTAQKQGRKGYPAYRKSHPSMFNPRAQRIFKTFEGRPHPPKKRRSGAFKYEMMQGWGGAPKSKAVSKSVARHYGFYPGSSRKRAEARGIRKKGPYGIFGPYSNPRKRNQNALTDALALKIADKVGKFLTPRKRKAAASKATHKRVKRNSDWMPVNYSRSRRRYSTYEGKGSTGGRSWENYPKSSSRAVHKSVSRAFRKKVQRSVKEGRKWYNPKRGGTYKVTSFWKDAPRESHLFSNKREATRFAKTARQYRGIRKVSVTGSKRKMRAFNPWEAMEYGQRTYAGVTPRGVFRTKRGAEKKRRKLVRGGSKYSYIRKARNPALAVIGVNPKRKRNVRARRSFFSLEGKSKRGYYLPITPIQKSIRRHHKKRGTVSHELIRDSRTGKWTNPRARRRFRTQEGIYHGISRRIPRDTSWLSDPTKKSISRHKRKLLLKGNPKRKRATVKLRRDSKGRFLKASSTRRRRNRTTLRRRKHNPVRTKRMRRTNIMAHRRRRRRVSNPVHRRRRATVHHRRRHRRARNPVMRHHRRRIRRYSRRRNAALGGIFQRIDWKAVLFVSGGVFLGDKLSGVISDKIMGMTTMIPASAGPWVKLAVGILGAGLAWRFQPAFGLGIAVGATNALLNQYVFGPAWGYVGPSIGVAGLSDYQTRNFKVDNWVGQSPGNALSGGNPLLTKGL